MKLFSLSNGVEAVALFLFALNCSKGKIAPGSQGLALTSTHKKNQTIWKLSLGGLVLIGFSSWKKIKKTNRIETIFFIFGGRFVKENNLNPFPLDDAWK